MRKALLILACAVLIAGTASAQSITVTSPTDGSSWHPGAVNTITWTSSGVANVKIKLVKDWAVDSWISGPRANTGSFNWRVPTTLALGEYRILVYSADDYSVAAVSDAFDVAACPLQFTEPTSEDEYFPGSPVNLTWTPGGLGGNVKIKLFKGGVFQSWVSGGTPNDGSFRYKFPLSMTYGTDYQFQIYSVEDKTKVAFSDEFGFTVCPLQITAPNGGETVWTGNNCTITWNNLDVPEYHVKIKLYKNNQFHSWISYPTPNTGTYTWMVPLSLATASDYKIVVYIAEFESVIDYSDAAFTIDTSK